MLLHIDCNQWPRRLALLVGALSLVLAGVLAPVHLARAHHGHLCSADTSQPSDCFVCLHWQHHAAQPAAAWTAPPVGPASTLIIAPSPRAGNRAVPASGGRDPPADVVFS